MFLIIQYKSHKVVRVHDGLERSPPDDTLIGQNSDVAVQCVEPLLQRSRDTPGGIPNPRGFLNLENFRFIVKLIKYQTLQLLISFRGSLSMM